MKQQTPDELRDQTGKNVRYASIHRSDYVGAGRLS